jgi:transketolase
LALASYYKLNNLIVFIDLNRLGQSQPTYTDHNTKVMKDKCEAFGALSLVVEGNDVSDVIFSLQKAKESKDKPTVLVCKTYKGKNFGETIENKEDWHGKPLGTEANKVLEELKKKMKNADIKMVPECLPKTSVPKPTFAPAMLTEIPYKKGDKVATRNAYGKALANIGANKLIVALDADTKNSTMTIDFKKAYPDRFIECFIAEQNMVGMAVGLSSRGYCPFMATFSAFFSRAFDFIRMAAISMANIKLVGSHCGISIGQDGSSQMGLEDIAMMRAVHGSVVFYPTDAVSCANAIMLAANYNGVSYVRTTRQPTSVLYDSTEKFEVGKAKLHKMDGAKVTIVAAGVTFEEAKKASATVPMNIVDIFTVKPIDANTIYESAKLTKGVIICVEDHYTEGGIFSAVAEALADKQDVRIYSLAVTKMPRSGQPEELLDMFGISAKSILEKIKSI